MTVVEQVEIKTRHGHDKLINLLHPDRTSSNRNYETTIVTGQNGSHKSTLLRQIVSDLTRPVQPESYSLQKNNADRSQVLCISGSVSDRFPQKRLPGGTRTEFDVPNYAYFGQRVLSNLLSKKAPLEMMLCFALAPDKAHRFKWKFFEAAHALAGVESYVTYKLAKRRTKNQEQRSLLDIIHSKRPEMDGNRIAARELPHVSYATAQWLLSEFTNNDFDQFDALYRSAKSQSFELTLDPSGPTCEYLDPNILRLGLLTDMLMLQDIGVIPLRSGSKFSAFDLSSGEFHMFSTIQAVGFGLNRKAVLLIDEPENNLHPQWQRDLMAAIFEVCSNALDDGHVIVCTHSPLIVGAAHEGSTVVDLTGEEPQRTRVSFGASSDELLLTGFGVGSSRNKFVVDKVQQAVSLVERGDFDNPAFKVLIPQLKQILDALTPEDPLVDVIYALIDEEPIQ